MKSDDNTYSNEETFNDQQIGSNIQAPMALQKKIQSRIELYKNHLSAPLSQEQLSLAMQDERWEVRSATVKNISKRNSQMDLYLFEQYMDDNNPYVRMTALNALAMLDLPNINHFLSVGLQDKNYQVREMAVLLFASLKGHISTEVLEKALRDEDGDVREAAKEAWQRSEIQRPKEMPSDTSNTSFLPSLFNTHTKKEQKTMVLRQVTAENDKMRARKVFLIPQKFSRGTYLIVLASTLVLVMGILMGAGFGWWNLSFDDPALYTVVNQQQTHQGVAIRVTQVYADEGRTIIAYDISSQDPTKQYMLNNFDLLGSALQKQETLSGIYQDRPEQGVQHLYMVEPPFLIPAKVGKLTLTLNVGEVIVTKMGETTNSTISGPWHFVFTVPFHHENNKHIANPLHGDVYINQ